ncbi:aminoglycoside phosphotransferase protein [Apiospora arundinis]|uniref:Aminoglycoside phosphotransferase protein n=1 Tax=Apiospora arundinis TaxID=335852 RepID=A0ABR2HZC9_9PEZI
MHIIIPPLVAASPALFIAVLSLFLPGKPTQKTLDDHAKAILGGTSVRPVELQGSLSYTVVVTTEKIVSFRVSEQGLGGELDRLAAEIHGDLAPEATNYGMIGNGEEEAKDAGQSLHVVSMPYLPGKAYYEVNWNMPLEDKGALKRQLNFNIHLARYFARVWKNPQPVAESELQAQRVFLLGKLAILKQKPQFDYLKPHLDELEGEGGIEYLFSQNYPQTLAHDDLSPTNVLVDEETFAIQGIIDWSLAKVAPFGWDYFAVRKFNGIAGNENWTDYSDRPLLDKSFWEEFFGLTEISDAKKQAKLKHDAILATKLATIMHYCFCKTLSGTPVDFVHPEPPCYVDGWLGTSSWDDVVQPSTDDSVQPPTKVGPVTNKTES